VWTFVFVVFMSLASVRTNSNHGTQQGANNKDRFMYFYESVFKLGPGTGRLTVSVKVLTDLGEMNGWNQMGHLKC
jgi:hypothetical protein